MGAVEKNRAEEPIEEGELIFPQVRTFARAPERMFWMGFIPYRHLLQKSMQMLAGEIVRKHLSG